MPTFKMRISCPNCETGYEVPEVALMGRTRTLRCSRCGMAWQAGFPFRTSLPKQEDELPMPEMAAAPPPPVITPPPPEPMAFTPPVPAPEPVAFTPPEPAPAPIAMPAPPPPPPAPEPIRWTPEPPPAPEPEPIRWSTTPPPPEPVRWSPEPPPFEQPAPSTPRSIFSPPPEPAPAPEPPNWAAFVDAPAAPPPPEPVVNWAAIPPAPEPEPASWTPTPPPSAEPEPDSQRWTPDLPQAPEPAPSRWSTPLEPENTRWAPAPEPEPVRWDPAPALDPEPSEDEVRWPPLPEKLLDAEPVRWPQEPEAWSQPTESSNPFEEFAYEKKSKKPSFDAGARDKGPEWRTMPPESPPDPRKLPFQDFEPEPRAPLPGFLNYDDDHDSDVRDKFSALVTLDQGKPLVREPEPPLYEGEANQQTIKIVLALLVVLIAMAGAVVEHRLIIHFLPASAKFFSLLGLK